MTPLLNRLLMRRNPPCLRCTPQLLLCLDHPPLSKPNAASRKQRVVVNHFSTFFDVKRRYFSSLVYPQNDKDATGIANKDDSTVVPTLTLRDARLPVAQHLDPDGTTLPTSDWIHINGTLPIGSLDHVLQSVVQLLLLEEQKGIIDLDAEWNPVHDPQVPLVSLEDVLEEQGSSHFLVEAAHVVLSPYGRPNGWHLKLANRSLVYALLDCCYHEQTRLGWKLVTLHEYHYSKEKNQQEDPSFTDNNGLIVDDTMVRIENCPMNFDRENVRHMMRRYNLALHGDTILQWNGKTNDGKVAPLMYIVRFESAAWARAAIRELQATFVNGRAIKLVQYPKQLRYQNS